jgi:hypothetical protein
VQWNIFVQATKSKLCTIIMIYFGNKSHIELTQI